MSHYNNSNGLVKGLIPAGKSCPFLIECNSTLMEKGRCPTTTKPKEVAFSCGFARAYALINNKGK